MKRSLWSNIDEFCFPKIGLGKGNFLQYANQPVWRITGTEMHPETFGRGKEKGFEVLYLVQLFKRFYAFLMKDGRMLLHSPNEEPALSLFLQNCEPTLVNYIGVKKITFNSAQSGRQVGAAFKRPRALQEPYAVQAIFKLLMNTSQADVDIIASWVFHRGTNVLFVPLNLIVVLRQKS